MELDTGREGAGHDVLLADWETIGDDALRADICVPATRGRAGPVGPELSSAVVLEVCRVGIALVTHRSEEASPEWCFVLHSFSLEWHGLPPTIPTLGAIWCELIVETDGEGWVPAERAEVAWRCTLVAAGRSILTGHLEGRLASTGTDRDANRIPPHLIADAVLSTVRRRSPEGQVHLIEMTFGELPDRDAHLALDLAWEPDAEVNVFSVRQGPRAVAMARIGLVGRESLGRDQRD